MFFRWVFVLDKNSPKFSVMTEFYQEQLKQGLSTNVLINGKWHHVYKTNLREDSEDSTSNLQLGLVNVS